MKITTASVLMVLYLVCTGPLAKVKAVNPPPDGGYAGGNTAEGQSALFSLTTGVHNTALGFQALFHNTSGNANMASGSLALRNNTTGIRNTAAGFSALSSNTTGFGNTATGCLALSSNATGSDNTATGFNALLNNSTGHQNTADGQATLFNNVSGAVNTAVGRAALFNNTSGDSNTAVGESALGDNVSGSNNTAIGGSALPQNTTGFANTAIGGGTLNRNSTGNLNTGLGSGAGLNVTTASHVTCIGADAAGANVENSTWIGNVFGVTTVSGVTAPVIVSDTGQLGTLVSSERFKKDIATMEKASEAILSLRPVTFHYKSDSKGTPQFGLIAEDVAKVNPGLVVRDKSGEIYSVRYDAVNAMLLNEFLKEHSTVQQQSCKIQEQEATIAQLRRDLQATAANQQKQIEALTAGLQKVSAQLEVSKPATHTVLNNQ